MSTHSNVCLACPLVVDILIFSVNVTELRPNTPSYCWVLLHNRQVSRRQDSVIFPFQGLKDPY